MRRYSVQIEANKNFKIEVEEPNIEKKNTEPGQFVTNCIVCNRTCHERCNIRPPETKEKCIAMKNGECTVCPGKCHHSNHTNADFYFVITIVKKWLTRDELFKEY